MNRMREIELTRNGGLRGGCLPVADLEFFGGGGGAKLFVIIMIMGRNL